MHQSELAAHFRRLHTRKPLILPNAWDAASARVIEAAGALAIATTSAGVSWSFGRADGQKLRREEMLQVISNIVQSVKVPVSADVESGYGNGSGKDVADTVQALISLGVAGINLEDSPAVMGRCCSLRTNKQSAFALRDKPQRRWVAICLSTRERMCICSRSVTSRRGRPLPWNARGCTGAPVQIVCLCRASSISAPLRSWSRPSTDL